MKKKAAKNYSYAAGRDGEVSLILRRQDNTGPWEVVANLNEGVDVEDMVADLNRAQRTRPVLAEGQELVKRNV